MIVCRSLPSGGWQELIINGICKCVLFSSFYVHTIPRDDGQDSEVAVLIEFSVVEVKDYADSWAGCKYVSFLFVSISLCLCID